MQKSVNLTKIKLLPRITKDKPNKNRANPKYILKSYFESYLNPLKTSK